MSARCFVDTNVLLYAHSKGLDEKTRKARALVEELWRERSGVVSTQVLQELYLNACRKTERLLRPSEAGQPPAGLIDARPRLSVCCSLRRGG